MKGRVNNEETRLKQETQNSSCVTEFCGKSLRTCSKSQSYQVETQCNHVLRAASLCENAQKAKKEAVSKAGEKLDNMFKEN